MGLPPLTAGDAGGMPLSALDLTRTPPSEYHRHYPNPG